MIIAMTFANMMIRVNGNYTEVEVSMNQHRADEKIEQIQALASEIENDDELKGIDERYSVMASWIDTDIKNVSL